MIDIIKNTLLYFSAFIPMYLLIQVRFIADIIFDNVVANAFTITVLCFMGLMIILGLIGLLWNIKWCREKSERVIIKQANNITDQHFLGYFSIFILFALGFDLSRVSMFGLFLCITLFIGIVYIQNKLFFINPFLNILGFNFYEIKYVKVGQTETRTTKIFYRGRLIVTNDPCNIKLKNEHFSFLEYCKEKRPD
ncbi:MAG: hypothetical protein FWE31_02630 [Firmicutes bacterium]|nr:hypothetical protein [Bacillota bacterium]